PANSFRDLAFLIPEGSHQGNNIPPPFLVFFDNTKEAERGCKYLHSQLPRDLGNKVQWFHSTITQQFCEEQVEAMKKDELWGLCCTDAFGMGMDLPNIEIVVQWKATADLCTLWQRFGRAARGNGKTGTAILLVKKKDTKDMRKTKAEKAAKKKSAKDGVGKKRK
ncbi:P-loop containing nucleoside triphosphate hydrolase protein, partial [Crassisporium funariophilum]